MENKSYYTAVGAFVILTVSAIVGVYFWLHHHNTHAESQSYLVYFSSSVAGLSLGSPVKYKGILVGSVTNIEISLADIDEIAVEISVNRSTPVTEGSVASIEMAGITGESFIQLEGAVIGAPPLKTPKGSPYPIIPAGASALQEIFKTTPELLTHVDELVEALTPFLSPANQRAFTQTLNNVENITRDLKRAPLHFERALTKVESAVDTFDQTLRSIDKLVTTLQEICQENRSGIHSLTTETVSGFTDLIGNFKYTLSNLDAFLKSVLTKLHTLLPAPSPQTYTLL